MPRWDSASPDMPRKRRRLRSQSSMASDTTQPTWPPTKVPVEIFDEITTYLSRSDVKNLRLVNHEFDRMVSAKYFRNVVVPFRSEMYQAMKLKVSLEDDDNEQAQPGKDTLFSSGMRIFQSFGDHILRFALSLEIDEESLAYPPIKPTQKAITSYWGIYRWPHESYLRYTELEGLEQTADETASMKEALRCLAQVQELGLCCDAGLGYLLGPDQQLESPPLPHPVFGLRNLRYRTLQRRLARADSDAMNARKLAFESPRDFKYTVLESMVRNAGYTQDQAKDAIAMLLSTENVSLTNIDFDERTAAAAAALANPESQGTNRVILQHVNAGPDQDHDENFARTVVAALNDSTAGHPLQPRNLTRGQKEMLLELEWAHRALIQSYVIALIDNARLNSFNSLTTLTIAKIPSSHIFMFQRPDFWRSLPNLTNVALAVVADWRQVAKVAPGCVEDTFVSPVDSVTKVHRLLQDHVGQQENIKFLHFEWICGGEFAPGMTQRNLYVLPVPICSPEQMVHPETAKLPGVLLSLPHVKHLSLKNCYATPHVFLQAIRTMAQQSLQKLELESVSLTGSPTRDQGHINAVFHPHAHVVGAPIQIQVQAPGQAQIQAAQQVAEQQQQPPPLPPAPLQPQANLPPALGFGQAGAVILPPIQPPMGIGAGLIQVPPPLPPANQVPPPPPDPTPNWSRMRLRQPKLLSWAGILERLSPAPSIQELLASQGDELDGDDWVDDFVQRDDGFSFIPHPHGLVGEKASLMIEHISFKSCGYVLVDVSSIDNTGILGAHSPRQAPQDIMARRRELAPFMQMCTDRLAAKITNHMTSQEHFNLTTAFGVDTEWTNVYNEAVIDAAKTDGIIHPGRGRFSGAITKTAQQD
ncbi:F-box domain-containing protein [Colletotrichum tofieldiae]|uniref:F-box domain-containing protein n=1 Tax=Colletotrichum tofieldiae TaxID=708197 RepID=A0A166PR21_9PEZI|nr:F-box domain-containing protein [Colletotrichum tofieldiae]GKT66694.1 F-box domain-containing protein [Colletotrichum tofieldiae]GKT71761.1 F-box domain-containing protein [Colletotrichum tofieldiae]